MPPSAPYPQNAYPPFKEKLLKLHFSPVFLTFPPVTSRAPSSHPAPRYLVALLPPVPLVPLIPLPAPPPSCWYPSTPPILPSLAPQRHTHSSLPLGISWPRRALGPSATHAPIEHTPHLKRNSFYHFFLPFFINFPLKIFRRLVSRGTAPSGTPRATHTPFGAIPIEHTPHLKRNSFFNIFLPFFFTLTF
jgi:hypothetical protein